MGTNSPPGKVEPLFAAAEVQGIKRRAYNEFDLEGFKARRRAFDTLDLSKLRAEIVPAVERVLSPRPGLGFVFPTSWDEVPATERVWRARSVTDDLRERLEQDLVVLDDLWQPPAASASSGRMNRAGDAVLYGCRGYPPGALAEARIAEPGASFLLIRYEVVAPMVTRRVGSTNADPALTPRQQRIEHELSTFGAQVMSAVGGSRSETLYEMTQALLDVMARYG